jgi:lambda family phage portal protein
LKIIPNILAKFGYRKVSRRFSGRRSYSAAKNNNMTDDWNTTGYTADQEIRFDLLPLRSRARDLVNNDPYARKYMTLRRENVIGSEGFILQMKIGTRDADGTVVPDEYANRIIKDRWEDWCKPENCSVSGKLSFLDICNLVSDHSGRDGEFLVRRVMGSSFKYGIKLEVLEPDLLNEKLNMKLENGNVLRMGVEIDAYRKPIAYYITKVRPELEVYLTSIYSYDWDRILADEIYHGFDKQRAFQTRGVPVFAPVMLRLKMLEGYEEAALVNARASACKMGVFESDEGETYEGDEKDDNGDIITDAEPGTFYQLPPGVRLNQFDPKYPDAQHEMFVKVILRGIAAGLGVSYNSLADDLESVNYSSIRAGLLQERENWKAIQSWFIEGFLEPVFDDWLEAAYMAGGFTNPGTGKSLPIMSKWEYFDRPNFVGRRWDWVDPKNDVDASIYAVDNLLSTLTDELASKGKELEATLATRAHEEALIKKYGLSPGALTSKKSLQPGMVDAGAPAPGSAQQKSLAEKILDLREAGYEVVHMNGNGHG